MTRTRSSPCLTCSNKIDKYDDTIKCNKCDNIFHIKCANVTMKIFNDLREGNILNTWICDKCTTSGKACTGMVLAGTQVSDLGVYHENSLQLKLEMNKLLNEAVIKITASFDSRLSDLCKLVMSQSEEITKLTKEIQTLRSGKDDNERPAVWNSHMISQTNTNVKLSTEEESSIDPSSISKTDQDGVTLAGDNWASEGASSVNMIDEGWTEVKSKKKPKSPQIAQNVRISDKMKKSHRPIIGKSKSSALKSAPRKPLSHIHVSRLDPFYLNC
ncbi:hypothetical protein WA026_021843 [Henosepilachna vigintioctopunctata]|uniref:PHD-type domain-containing protein n=1 Tax=Henosepilachna vigintioctopunctata TaxID=420089 RepID=A0AAW1URQ2_9CUCU